MKKRNYSNADGELLTYQQAAERCNLGLTTTAKIARESGALVKIGKVARVRWDVFYKYILERNQA